MSRRQASTSKQPSHENLNVGVRTGVLRPPREPSQVIGNRGVLDLLGSERVQRKGREPEAGDQLERQADQIADAVVPGAAQGRAETPAAPRPALIVEDEAAAAVPGQMRKSDFLAQVRAAVCATAEEGLAAGGKTAQGCPWIEYWLSFYGGKDASHLERAIEKFAPDAAGAAAASDYVPMIAARVRTGVDQYSKTGEAPQMPEEMPGAGILGGIGSISFKAREGGPGDAHPAQIRSRLGPGQPLEGTLRSPMESAFGVEFSHVRVHTDPQAAALSDSLNARAFAVGSHIAFGTGEYQPDSPIGQALVAHELAHVVQQSGAGIQRSEPGGEEASSALEQDADTTAVRAMVSIAGGIRGLAKVSRNAQPRLKSGLRLQRCGRHDPEPSETPEIEGTPESLGGHAVACMIRANTDPKTKNSGIWYAQEYESTYPDEWKDNKDEYEVGYANKDYWENIGQWQWRLKKGRSASAGVKAWLKGLTIAECYSTAIVSEVDSIRASIGDKKFDELYGSEDKAVSPRLELGADGSNALAGGTLQYNPPSTDIGTVGHRPAKVGEWHYFYNHPLFLLKHPGGAYQGENALLRSDTSPDGEQLWEGLGQPKVTEKEMYANMIYTYNQPRDVFDNRALDEIKKSHGGTLPPAYDPANKMYPDQINSYQEILDAPESNIDGTVRKGGYSPTSGKKLDPAKVQQLKDKP